MGFRRRQKPVKLSSELRLCGRVGEGGAVLQPCLSEGYLTCNAVKSLLRCVIRGDFYQVISKV